MPSDDVVLVTTTCTATIWLCLMDLSFFEPSFRESIQVLVHTAEEKKKMSCFQLSHLVLFVFFKTGIRLPFKYEIHLFFFVSS